MYININKEIVGKVCREMINDDTSDMLVYTGKGGLINFELAILKLLGYTEDYINKERIKLEDRIPHGTYQIGGMFTEKIDYNTKEKL